MSRVEEDKFERERYYGLSLPRKAEFIVENPFLQLNQEKFRNLVRLRQLPQETAITSLYPPSVLEIARRRKIPRRISQVSQTLANVGYQGIILAQVIVGPAIDITEKTRETFRKTIFEIPEVLLKYFAIRCWTMDCEVQIERPPADTESQYGSLDPFTMQDRVKYYVIDSSIVKPDTQILRSLPLAVRQGTFTIITSNQTYPLPLNQYEFEISWEGVSVKKQFGACRDQVDFIDKYEQIQGIDQKAADLFEADNLNRSFGKD